MSIIWVPKQGKHYIIKDDLRIIVEGTFYPGADTVTRMKYPNGYVMVSNIHKIFERIHNTNSAIVDAKLWKRTDKTVILPKGLVVTACAYMNKWNRMHFRCLCKHNPGHVFAGISFTIEEKYWPLLELEEI